MTTPNEDLNEAMLATYNMCTKGGNLKMDRGSLEAIIQQQIEAARRDYIAEAGGRLFQAQHLRLKRTRLRGWTTVQVARWARWRVWIRHYLYNLAWVCTLLWGAVLGRIDRQEWEDDDYS